MARRGRPPHPDILTPREWEVLDLLREGLTNEQIAQRLDVGLATAKYHVSEILSKLGVKTREEAAAWEPEGARPWWAVGLAIIGWPLRRLLPLTALKFAGAALVLAAIGVGVAWAVLTAGSHPEEASLVDGTPPTSPVSRPIDYVTPSPVGDYLDSQKRAVSEYGVFAINSDGTGEHQLAMGLEPIWSPTGSDIAYVGAWTGTGLGGRNWIDVMRADGTDTREIGFYDWDDIGGDCWASRTGIWSPDGRFFLYASQVDGRTRLVDVATGSSQEIFRVCYPSWAPDGQILVYAGACDAPGTWPCLRSVEDVTAGVPGTVLAAGSKPSWSRDGRRIAFVRDRSLFVLDMRSGEETWLYDLRVEGPDVPSWSPDGKRIAVSSERVMVIDLASGSATPVGSGLFARWSPSGQQLAFYDWQAGYTVRVADPDTGDEIFSVTGENFDWSPDGKRLVFSRPLRLPQ